MILPRYLSVRTKRARNTKELRSNEVEGGNMSVTCSTRIAQTDNSFLKGDCYVITPTEIKDDNMSITRSILRASSKLIIEF